MGQGSKDVVEIVSADLTCRVDPRELMLLDCVESASSAANRPPRPLLLQALLQLPRVADREGLARVSVVKLLLTELAQELPAKSEWLVAETVSSPRELDVQTLNSITARDVMQRFHYLRSPRIDGRAYGLSTGTNRLVALCVSSPVDVARLHDLLACDGRGQGQARVISRVFAFEGAPSNSISYMLSRVAREERRLGVTDFVTYVNPNLGFHGSSYRASGWQLLGIESGTKYRYLDGRYITDRELMRKFGAHSDEAYQRLLDGRFAVSVMPLEPLVVFHSRLLESDRPPEKTQSSDFCWPIVR
jgi:hypothetical protein